MAIGSSGAIRLGADIGVEVDQTLGNAIEIKAAARGTYATINTVSASYPNGADPHLFSEWYSYNHDATSGPAQGDYGNSSSTIVWTGNQGSSSNIITDVFTLSHSSLCGASVIGRTAHVYLRLKSTTTSNGYKQDAQLKAIRASNSGLYQAVGGTNTQWGWALWDTTRRTTNTSYDHSTGWYDVETGGVSGRWNQDINGTPSGSTGIDVGSTGCIYYEGSGGHAYNKHVYLRSPEFTISSDTFEVRTHGYGAHMGTLYFGIYLTD